ncbi:hypothetical protein SK128_024255, partial [Halocaridina rubra]
VIRVSQSHFSDIEGALNIHAHKLREIAFDGVTWDVACNLLIRTADNHVVERISISNSHMETLDQINVSSRQVSFLWMKSLLA